MERDSIDDIHFNMLAFCHACDYDLPVYITLVHISKTANFCFPMFGLNNLKQDKQGLQTCYILTEFHTSWQHSCATKDSFSVVPTNLVTFALQCLIYHICGNSHSRVSWILPYCCSWYCLQNGTKEIYGLMSVVQFLSRTGDHLLLPPLRYS